MKKTKKNAIFYTHPQTQTQIQTHTNTSTQNPNPQARNVLFCNPLAGFRV
jgi:hypothetical protein